MRTSVYLYPWDVLGDPAAAARLADLGVDEVSVAASYHAVRAASPNHPRHLLVTAPRSAVYYPPDSARWSERRLRPAEATWAGAGDSLGYAVAQLTSAGLSVNAWIVLLHVDGLVGEDGPVVVNAFGDRYPWALCPARQEVREYAATLAAEIAERPGLSGLELEAAGWYGLEHGSAHDKTFSLDLGPVETALLSLCFCATCQTSWQDADIPVSVVQQRIRDAVRAHQGGSVAEVLGEFTEPVRAVRVGIAASLRGQILDAVAGSGLRTTVHSDLEPWATGAFPALDLTNPGTLGDEVMLPWSAPAAAAVPDIRPQANVAARLDILDSAADMVAQIRSARDADSLRFYHAGIATPAQLSAFRDALKETSSER